MSSVRQNEIDNAITTLKPKTQVTVDTSDVIRFNSDGQSDDSRENKFKEDVTCASLAINGRNRVYRVRSGRGGKFYNPLKDGRHYGLNEIDRTTNDKMFILREVNENCFKNYIKFLQTKYDSYLSAAERN